MKLLLHTCCAPCSVYCIDTLKKDNIDITSYWYNPNIHPYTEYKERLNALKDYTKSIDIPLIIDDYYGLRQFCKNVVDKLDNRCGYCYYSRLEKTAIYAKEHGFDAFSTTLLISPYQNHELLKKTGKIIEAHFLNFFSVILCWKKLFARKTPSPCRGLFHFTWRMPKAAPAK